MERKSDLVSVDPEVQNGALVFAGTRVPVQTLMDYLEAGQSLNDFLDDFPSVSRDQAVGVLEEAGDALLARARSA